MTSRVKTKINISTTKEISAMMGSGMFIKVGIVGDEAATEREKKDDKEESLSNAEVGLKHEFGSVTEKIPIRSFLKMPLETKFKSILKAMSSITARSKLEKGKIKDFWGIVGAAAESVIQDAFESGGFGKWKPLSPITKLKKGSSQILIDTAQLRKAITSEVVKK